MDHRRTPARRRRPCASGIAGLHRQSLDRSQGRPRRWTGSRRSAVGQLAPGTALGKSQPPFSRGIDKRGWERMEAAGKRRTSETRRSPVCQTATPAVTSSNTQAGRCDSRWRRCDRNRTARPAGKIGIDDFAKVEMRVGQIKTAERIVGADKLLKLTVDIGTEVRQICAGIAQFYEPEKLVGRKVAVVVNLAPRKLRGVESNGMIIAAAVGPDGRPVLAGFPDEDVEVGARLR